MPRKIHLAQAGSTLQPSLEICVRKKPFRQQLIADRKWMAGVGVKRARQDFRPRIRNLVLRQPGGDAVAKSSIGRAALFGEQVFVERTEDHKHISTSPAESID